MEVNNLNEYKSPSVKVWNVKLSNPIAGSLDGGDEPGAGGNEGFGSEDI